MVDWFAYIHFVLFYTLSLTAFCISTHHITFISFTLALAFFHLLVTLSLFARYLI